MKSAQSSSQRRPKHSPLNACESLQSYAQYQLTFFGLEGGRVGFKAQMTVLMDI